MSRPIIGLLTDFGTRDHYVGTMKAVVLGICPEAALVDITHEVPPHDVLAGALELAAAYKYFPRGTIFLVVIDPGVGSSRRGLAAAAAGYDFVAPDNGVLSAVFAEATPGRLIELTERSFARPTVSRTFEGRDRFAPAAGWLATGLAIESLGRPVDDYQRLALPRARLTGDAVAGVVLRVDRFGNLVTNIDREIVQSLTRDRPFVVRVGDHEVARLVATYAEIAPGEACAMFGSSDHLEIAVNGASAAERLTVGRGTAVVVQRR
jgi:S-adenosylmethionine hydrolase